MYIDAEKLSEKIESIGLYAQKSADYNDGREDMKMVILDIIASLQQEQLDGLHFTPLNRLIQKIPTEKWNDSTNNYAKKLRDCLIKEGYVKDAEVLQGYISYMNGNNVPMATMDEQEQPEAIGGVVHHALGTHWIVTNRAKLGARLKQFPEGAEIEILIEARKKE